ncbi:MAG: hypothetical protein NTZ48_00300 [Candidatus Omnitrophica bacterium]|nr:hypothetical protein [Candidatus Omnitrophota bacterium]
MKTFYEFKKFNLVFLMGMLIFYLTGCSICSKSVVRNQSQFEGYPIASDVFTTLQRTVVPGPKPTVKIYLDEISKYKQYGYGNWSYGPGIDYVKRLDIMPANYSGISAVKKEKLLNFFTITDIHITDKESPNQLIYLQRLHPTSPFGVSLYGPISESTA